MADNTQITAQQAADAGAQTAGQESAGTEEIEFTPEQQAKIDKIIQDRLARATKNTLSKEEIKLLKDKAAEADRLKAEKLTDDEKRQARIKELEENDKKKRRCSSRSRYPRCQAVRY